MLCQFLLYSKVSQLHIHIYPLLFRFCSHIGHYRVLNRVPCAIHQLSILYIVLCKFINLFFIYKFILFLAALGLHFCMQAFSSCGKWGLLFIAVHRLLIAVASLVVKHRLQACGLQQLWHMGSVVVAHGLQSAGSVVVAHGLSCSAACGIFPDQGSNLCPLHWQVDS